MGLKVENVKKVYGNKIAVNDISFEIERPEVFGLLGTNGARKDYNNKNDAWNYQKRWRQNHLE